MNKYSIKAAACALVGTLSLSGYQTTLEAKLNNTSDVPAAGVAVVLDESSTIQDLQVEVVQNIAYLESASGLQPNIVLASEKVALAEAPSSVVMSNTKKATAKVSTEFVQELSESVSETEFLAADEEASENAEAAHSVETPAESQETAESEWETIGWGTLDQELTTQEASEDEASSGETDSAEQTSESSTEETTTEASTEGDFETSAGFSALDTYDDTEETTESGTELETESETESETETETQEDAQDFSGLVIARVTNYVNVRSIPSEEGEIVGKL